MSTTVVAQKLTSIKSALTPPITYSKGRIDEITELLESNHDFKSNPVVRGTILSAVSDLFHKPSGEKNDKYFAAIGSIVKLLRTLEGPRAAGLLVKYLEKNESAENRRLIIEALGDIGHALPVQAILALRRCEKNREHGELATTAISSISSKLTSKNRLYTKTSGDFTKQITPRLKKSGIGPWGLLMIGLAIDRNNITTTREMTALAIKKMKPGHPIATNRSKQLLKAINGV